MALNNGFNFLNIKPPEKPRAENEAYIKTIRGMEDSMANHGDLSSLKPELSVVVDPFSGRFYGEHDVSVYTDHLTQQLQGYEQAVKMINNGIRPYTPSNDEYGLSNLSIASLLPMTPKEKEEALKTYSESIAATTKDLDNFKSNFTFQDLMEASFNRNTANWNAYFKGNYKNTRLTEAQDTQVSSSPSQGESLAIGGKIPRKASRTTGTGLSSTGSLNPYGKLDSGLNI